MRKKIIGVVLWGFQIMLLCSVLLPILMMLRQASPGDFHKVLIEDFWFYPKFWLSLGVAVTIGVGSVAVALLAAFGMRVGRLKHKKAVLFLLLLLMLMPLQVTLLPNYIGLRDLKLLDTFSALVLPMIFSPFAIYLMYQYMETVPYEGWEAARLETSSVCRILGWVIMPQMRACMAAVFVFMFAEGFNMVEQPLYFVKQEKWKTLSVLIESLADGEKHLIYAVGIICTIPLLLLYGFFKEELIEGMGYLQP